MGSKDVDIIDGIDEHRVGAWVSGTSSSSSSSSLLGAERTEGGPSTTGWSEVLGGAKMSCQIGHVLMK